METIYNWLLHNVGNEGNYLTILNVQHLTNEAGTPILNVMARTKDFKVINLIIRPEEIGIQPNSTSATIADRTVLASYLLGSEQHTVTYLSEGQIANTSPTGLCIRVILLEPAHDAGEIIFPEKK